MNEQSYYIKHTADRNTATQFVFMQPIFKLTTRWQTLAGRWYLRTSSSRGPSDETSQMMQIPILPVLSDNKQRVNAVSESPLFLPNSFWGIQPFVTSQRAEVSADADLALEGFQPSRTLRSSKAASVQVLDLRGGPGGLRTSQHFSVLTSDPFFNPL